MDIKNKFQKFSKNVVLGLIGSGITNNNFGVMFVRGPNVIVIASIILMVVAEMALRSRLQW